MDDELRKYLIDMEERISLASWVGGWAIPPAPLLRRRSRIGQAPAVGECSEPRNQLMV